MAFADWYMSDKAMNSWATDPGLYAGNNKAKIPNELIGEIAKAAADGNYKSITRYWEASPSDIVLPAVEEFNRFMTTPTPEQAKQAMEQHRGRRVPVLGGAPARNRLHQRLVAGPCPPRAFAFDFRSKPVAIQPAEFVLPAGVPSIDEMVARERRHARKRFWTALAFMAPALVFVAGFLLLPVAFNIYASFTQWLKFKGLDQTGRLRQLHPAVLQPELRDRGLQHHPLGGRLVLPAGALRPRPRAARQGPPGRGKRSRASISCRGCSRRPPVGVLWYSVYAGEGIVNSGLRAVGLGDYARNWLYETNFATPAMIVTRLWQQVGLTDGAAAARPQRAADRSARGGKGRRRVALAGLPPYRPAAACARPSWWWLPSRCSPASPRSTSSG